MSTTPAPSTDKKTAPLLEEEVPVAAPPSYAESATPFSDGHIFSDQPRRQMIYTAAVRENYTPRSNGSWTSHLFSCFSDPGATVKAMCCPCISYGQTRNRLHHPGQPAPVCSAPCMGYFLAAMIVPGGQHIFGFLQRNEIRQKLEIDLPESRVEVGAEAGRERFFEGVQNAMGFISDAAAHLCCPCCSLTQEDREVRRWEVDECGAPGQWADEENAVREEGERLLGTEKEGLEGLRG